VNLLEQEKAAGKAAFTRIRLKSMRRRSQVITAFWKQANLPI